MVSVYTRSWWGTESVGATAYLLDKLKCDGQLLYPPFSINHDIVVFLLYNRKTNTDSARSGDSFLFAGADVGQRPAGEKGKGRGGTQSGRAG